MSWHVLSLIASIELAYNAPILMPSYPLLETIQQPSDIRALSAAQLNTLASEIRTAIIDQVSRSGGHLAPNLGVVELTLALHHAFDLGPQADSLLFDVGHQCYTHKLLTGRLGLLSKLRQAGGMSGFPEPAESDHDLFAVGHAGTAISTAVGMARADSVLAAREKRARRRVVALVGDSSIVNGVALEGLNHAGTLNRQLLVVLNDNGMSIAPPQGALSRAFDRLRVSGGYRGFKRRSHRMLSALPGGGLLEGFYHRSTEALRAMLGNEHLFEHFGLKCVGPVDGHDLPGLMRILEEVREMERPVLLHVKTVKGKGFEHAEGDATKFHSPSPFKVDGCRVEMPKKGRSFTAAFADALSDQMDADVDMMAITAAMPDGTGLNKVAERHPERTIDTGICESHAMDMAAGMAKQGLKPFFAVYATFAQRALDQIFQEVSLQGLPVRVCMDRGGYVGGDGAVHHGFMDIAMARALPGVWQLAAADEPNLRAAIAFMAGCDKAATLLRYPRDGVAEQPVSEEVPPFEPGKAWLAEMSDRSRKPDAAILAYGVMLYPALAAARALAAEGRNVAVYDARFAVPHDRELVRGLLLQGVPLVTVEDHAREGGFGSLVLDAAADDGLDTRLITRLGMPQAWVGPDSRAAQLAAAGLDEAGIRKALDVVLAARAAG